MPFMAIIYVLGTLVILVSKADELPGLFGLIVREAFTPTASFGGTALGVWNLTLLWGIKRALFSNEAGQGSAPIAHAAAKTKEPVREGVVAMVGPLIDTLTICTLTGLVIISTGVWDDKKADQLELDLDKIEVYSAMIEEERPLADADLNDDELELEEFEGETVVEKGSAAGIVFAVNDALIDGALLYHEGEPYTGPLGISENSVTGIEGESISLDIEGLAIQNSSALTSFAFQRGIEDAFGWSKGNWIVTFSVFLFAISTMISWSYYGDRCVEYLFGVRYVVFYRMIYVCFTFMGAVLALETVWAYGDLALGCMSVPNLIAVILLSPVLVRLTKDYFSRDHKRYK
jgi:AGCS family alanine or glycine:cation symporter